MIAKGLGQMARMKYNTPGKRFVAYRRRREQAAQPVVPSEIEVIELSDDVQVAELSNNTTSIVERAEGLKCMMPQQLMQRK